VLNPDHLPIIPTSVIDIGAQGKRKNEDHNNHSSRKNYSGFPTEVCDLCYSFYLRDSKNIFDPFAGWGERHVKAIEYDKTYIGFDISKDSIDKAFSDYGVTNFNADSRVADYPSYDGVLTCPPYWNLEKYSSDESLDRIKTWDKFLDTYDQILTRIYHEAAPLTTFCIQTGDWRKGGKYYDLVYETTRMFKRLGAETIDNVIISRKSVSKIKIMLPQAKRLGYSVRVHEVLMVFRKPESLPDWLR